MIKVILPRGLSRRARALLAAVAVLSVYACDSSDTQPLVTQPTPTMVTIGGGAVKGPVAGATVNIFAVATDGLKTGEPIATAITDSSGNYTATVSDFIGVYLVEISGGAYIDEATGTTQTIPEDAPLRAASAIEASGPTTITTVVTPLTEIATQVAQQKTGGLTSSNVSAGNTEVGTLFFGDNADAAQRLLTTTPADLTQESAATASEDARLMGMLVSAISQINADTGSLKNVIASLASDIVVDGNLGDSAAELIAATNKVVASPTNNSGDTSTSRVQNILTAATTGVETPVALSSDSIIHRFTFADTLVATIDRETMAISVLQPTGTSAAALISPTISISLGATVAADSGEDFTSPVNYIVTAEDGTTTTWTVTVTIAATATSSLANISAATNSLITSTIINRTTSMIVGSVASLADLTTLDEITDPLQIFSISDDATITRSSTGSFTAGEARFTVTAADGTTSKEWAVKLRVNDPQPQPAFSISNGDLNVATNATPLQLTLTGGFLAAPTTFSSSNSDVATVNATGLVTITGVGTTTLMASKARHLSPVVEYLPISAEITLTAAKANQSALTFAQANVSSLLSAGTLINSLTGGSGTGIVNYSSSNTDVATVAANGVVTLLAAGTTTITATKAADSLYLASPPATYVITVTVPEPTPESCVLDTAKWDECVL
jgi:hypothetical protein